MLAIWMRSLEPSSGARPTTPSGQELAMVLGALGSGPMPARPNTSAGPVSQERATVPPQLGAPRVASNDATRSLGPPTASVSAALWVLSGAADGVPRTVNE